MKSGSLNLLEPSGPVQACNGITLPSIENSMKLHMANGYDIAKLAENLGLT